MLVIGPAWVGDMVMAQSLLKLLAARHPGVSIDVLAPAWTMPLLRRMPEVRRAIPLHLGHGQLKLGVRRTLARELREVGYSQAIVLPNSLKSALIPYLAGIPVRTGFLGEWRVGLLNDWRRLDTSRLPTMAQRFAALGMAENESLPDELPQPELRVDPADVDSALSALGLARPDRPLLALCPGAEYGSAKRWPAQYYAEVARAKLAQGWAVWLFGSDRDRPVTQRVQALAGPECGDLAGRTTLAQAIDLLSLADAVVSNDSGLMHVAAALRLPQVAVFGSSSTGFTPPLNPRARALSLELPCSPCFKRECPLGHLRCLTELTPAAVLAAMEAP